MISGRSDNEGAVFPVSGGDQNHVLAKRYGVDKDKLKDDPEYKLFLQGEESPLNYSADRYTGSVNYDGLRTFLARKGGTCTHRYTTSICCPVESSSSYCSCQRAYIVCILWIVLSCENMKYLHADVLN